MIIFALMHQMSIYDLDDEVDDCDAIRLQDTEYKSDVVVAAAALRHLDKQLRSRFIELRPTLDAPPFWPKLSLRILKKT